MVFFFFFFFRKGRGRGGGGGRQRKKVRKNDREFPEKMPLNFYKMVLMRGKKVSFMDKYKTLS